MRLMLAVAAMGLVGCGPNEPSRIPIAPGIAPPSRTFDASVFRGDGSIGGDGGASVTGDHCRAAVMIPDGSERRVFFRLLGANPNHTPLTCGVPERTPDVAFVWTALSDERVDVAVGGGSEIDDLVLEVL